MRRREVVAASLAIFAVPAVAAARGRLPKRNVSFQFEPKDGARCGGCRLFVPGDSAKGPGTCRVVEGAIIQQAWCVLWEDKTPAPVPTARAGG